MTRRTETVPVALADGTIIQVQATSLGGEEEITFGVKSFEDIRKAIEGIAQETNDVLATVKPRKANVEFEVEVEVAAEAVMCRGMRVKQRRPCASARH